MVGSVCLSFEVRDVLENGIFLFAKPPKERRGFEKRKVECLGLVLCDGVLFGFDSSSELPNKGGEFAGDGDFDFVVMELALFEHFEAVTETGLSLPGEFFDPSGGSFLSLGKLSADFGRNAVVGGLFDKDPAGVWVSAFANSPPTLFVTTGVFARNETKEGHEFFGMFEAAEGSDF